MEIPEITFNGAHASRGLDRLELDQLTPLLAGWTAQHSSRYRTLAAYSRFCSDQHLSALPVSQRLVREYLETTVLRAEVSPWTARIVYEQLRDAFHDINSIIRSKEEWETAAFEGMLADHEREWQGAEADRLARLEVDDALAPLPINMSEDEQSDTGSASGRRGLRARRPKKLLSPELVIQTRRAAAVGMKRTRSGQSPAPPKRQRLDSPGLLSPLSAPDNVLFGSDARADAVHPNARRSSRRMQAQDSDSELSAVPSEPSSPISKPADSSSQSDRTLKLPKRSERARSEDSSSIVDYDRYDEPSTSPVSSATGAKDLPDEAAIEKVDFIALDDDDAATEREQTPVPPSRRRTERSRSAWAEDARRSSLADGSSLAEGSDMDEEQTRKPVKRVDEDFVAFESSDVGE